MSTAKCCECGNSEMPLYRQNDKGENKDPKWTCVECLMDNRNGIIVDPITKDLVNLISGK